MFELSKFQMCVNICFTTTLDIKVQVVSHSIRHLFFEANKCPLIKSVNEVTGKDV